MSRLVVLGLCAVMAGGCLTVGDCERRVRAARRDALRDAEACRFEPEALDHADCITDRTPLLAYYGTWCSTADATCIRDDSRAQAICFGRPTDTGPAPTSTRTAWPTP